jgi:hypothetical protein
MGTTRAAIYLVLTLACPGAPAAAQDLLEQVPTDSVVVRGTYSVLASCVFARLDETGLKKTDLQNEIRLTLEPGATRYWQLTDAGRSRLHACKSHPSANDLWAAPGT